MNRARQKRLFTNFSKLLEQYLGGKSYSPLNIEELFEKLNVTEEQKTLFNEVISHLREEGVIEITKGRISLVKEQTDIVTGMIRVHPRGFGFLIPDDRKNHPLDIFVPKHLTHHAVDGDYVEVLINQESLSEKGPEGKVIHIIKRGRTHAAGTIIEKKGIGEECLAYVPLLGISQKVRVLPSLEKELEIGDRVILKIIEWGDEKIESLGELSYYIGHISDPSKDIEAAIEEYELESDFSGRIKKEVKKFGDRIPISDIKGREDLRDQEIFTIDPDTAKDFDDALSLIKDKNGHYHLGVHIADVSHYVKPDSYLDIEAKERCNSTYFPGTVIPMLPHELSSHLCSLKEGVNRLTISVFMHFDDTGSIVDYRISRTVIKSAKRFTYKEAKQVIDGKKKSKHKDILDLMVELCLLLKRKRYERGSIEFSLSEMVVHVNSEGVPTHLEKVEYDITHQLVEEFMLKANEVVATHLSREGKPLTYRIHEEPSEENLKEFAQIAEAFGFKLSKKPTVEELQKFFEEAKTSPYLQYLSTSFIRSMRLATYSANNIGHYGLSLEYYCHFTSPIRRYVDLVVHRVLMGEIGEETDLAAIALTCSDKERVSARAEHAVVALKKLRLLKKIRDEDPSHAFLAIITQVKPFGFAFEIVDYMLESFLHVADLDNDYFIYEPTRLALRGRHHGITYALGDQIYVHLKSINLITLDSKWAIITKSSENIGSSHKEERSRKRRSSKNRSERRKKGSKT